MSHQVIITFDLDETKVQENAEKEAGRQIAAELAKNVWDNSYNSYGYSKRLADFVQDIVREMLEPHKDEIIEKAVRNVTENIHRTKAVKEQLAKAKEEE